MERSLIIKNSGQGGQSGQGKMATSVLLIIKMVEKLWTGWTGWTGQNGDSFLPKIDKSTSVGGLDRLDRPFPLSPVHGKEHKHIYRGGVERIPCPPCPVCLVAKNDIIGATC